MAQPQVLLNDRRDGPFVATAAQDVFTYTFPIEVDTEITVTQVIKIGGAITTPIFVAAIGAEGGTITLDTPAALDDEITIEGDRSLVRTSNYVTGGNYRGEDINFDLNRITKSLQELRRDADRSAILRPETANNVSAILPAPLQGTVIGWNAAGTALQNFATSVSFGLVPLDSLDPTGATKYDHIEFDGTDWVKKTTSRFLNILQVHGTSNPQITLGDQEGGAGFGALIYVVSTKVASVGSIEIGGSTVVLSDNGVTNTTFSGAAGSELATFVKDVVVGGKIDVDGILTVGDGTGAANLRIDGTSGSNSQLDFEEAGVMAWRIRNTNTSGGARLAFTSAAVTDAFTLADATGDATFASDVKLAAGSMLITNGSSGQTASNELVVESGGATAVTILGPDGTTFQLNFGSPSDANGGGIQYNSNVPNLIFGTLTPGGNVILRSDNNVDALTIDSSQVVTLKDELIVNGGGAGAYSITVGTGTSDTAFNAFRNVGENVQLISARPRIWLEGTTVFGQSIIFADSHSGATDDKRIFVIFNGGGSDSAKFETYNDAGVLQKTYMEFDHVTQQIRIPADLVFTTNAPSSKTDTGTVGTFTWARVDADNGFLYICTATDEWQRAATVSWV